MQGDRWHWHKDFLTCDLLSQWRHGWFGRQVYPLLPTELHEYFSVNGLAKYPRQVHGTAIARKDAVVNGETRADGIFSDAPDCSIWVCSADCVPVLMGNVATGAVLALHGGWRGTAAGILGEGLKMLQTQGSSLKDLRIALGPAISGAVYQVGAEVVEQVLTIVATKVGVVNDPRQSDRFLLDLRTVQRQFFLEAGICEPQIAIAPYCTYLHNDLFFSYRQHDRHKVQWSGIFANRPTQAT